MKSRLPFYLTLSVFAVACGGDSGDAGAMAESEAEAEAEVVVDDAAAVAAIAEGFVTHYNLHHASMVADLYTDEGIRLNANGEVNEGRDAIAASMEVAMGASPTLAVTPAEQRIIGDWAVTRGTYGVEVTPEGMEMMAYGGSYLSVAQKMDGEWKIALTITNYDSPRPDGWNWIAPDSDSEPVTDGPFAELIAGYMTHYNLGHAGMVADYYAEDASVAFADGPWLEGRAAITAGLEDAMAAGSPQLTVHNAGTWDMGESMYLDGGWYEVAVTTPDGEMTRGGTYVSVVSRGDDGSSQIHWMVSNGWPAGM
jgi:uncharacterized protein (TIGR02246 family)